LKKLSNRTQEALGSLSSVAQESLSALRTVQAFNAVTPEETKFGERVKTVLDLAKKEALASAIFYGWLNSKLNIFASTDLRDTAGSTGWAGNLTILTLLGYGMLFPHILTFPISHCEGGTLVSRGEISVGDLTSLLLYTAYVGSSLSMLT
jgi:ABC-type multidrug transport system fused ATPase/permease subunit